MIGLTCWIDLDLVVDSGLGAGLDLDQALKGRVGMTWYGMTRRGKIVIIL